MHPHVQNNVPSLVQEKIPPQDPNYPQIGNAMFEEFSASMNFLVKP